jgi:AcrR family transcriptional regulator
MAAETTRERILDAAERLFGAQGYEATSLRALTADADVNLAAVHYHFGSKEALLQAAAERRFEPINRERLRRLDVVEAAAGEGELPLEPVLEALFGPVLEAGQEPEDRAQLRRLAARVHGEAPEVMGPLLVELFGEVVRRFFSAFCLALPDLPPREVALRLDFSLGVLIHVMSGQSHVAAFPGMPDLPDREPTLVPRMVAFLAAGFRARYPGSNGDGARRRESP